MRIPCWGGTRGVVLLMLASAGLAAQTATVEGNVIDSVSGRPVPKADVWLLGTTLTGSPRQRDVYQMLTDARGQFLIQGVVPDRYTTRAAREGYLDRMPGLHPDPTLTAEVLLEPGQHGTVTLRLIPAGVISGRVVNPQGDPVPGAHVSAKQYDYSTGRKRLAERGTASVRANERGEYRIFRLPPGTYYVVFDGGIGRGIEGMPAEEIRGTPPPLDWATTYYPDAPDPSQARRLEVGPGSEVRDVEIRLRPEYLYSVRGARPGPPGNSLSLFIGPRSWAYGDPARLTNDAFEFKGLLPGSYIVTARRTDPNHPDRLMYARQFVDIVDRDVEGVTLRFSAGVDISGTVKVIGSELPYTFGKVSVQLQSDAPMLLDQPSYMGTPSADTTQDGTFLLRGVLPEVHQLSATSAPGTYVKAIRMGAQELPDFRVDFSKLSGPMTILLGTDGAGLEGVVRNSGGDPVKSATVTLAPTGSQQQRPERLRAASSDEKGHFTIGDVVPGEYQIFSWLNPPDGAPLDLDFRKPYEKLAMSVKLAPNARKTVKLKVISWGN
jgi:protocatechuate 3,4-dioxygenase beta subunit